MNAIEKSNMLNEIKIDLTTCIMQSNDIDEILEYVHKVLNLGNVNE